MWAVASAIMATCPVSSPELANDDIDPAVAGAWVNAFFAFAAATAAVSLVLTKSMDGPILDLSEFYAFTIASVRPEAGLIATTFFWKAYVRRRCVRSGFRLRP